MNSEVVPLPAEAGKKAVRFSQQEELILSLAAKGLADKEIANKIGISVGTVRSYWQRMRDKTHARSRSEILSQNLRHSHSQAVSELQRARARIFALVEASPVGLALMDEEGHFSEVNPAFLALVGITQSEFAASPIHEIAALKDLGSPTASVIVNGKGAMLHVLRQSVELEGKAHQVLTLIPALSPERVPAYQVF